MDFEAWEIFFNYFLIAMIFIALAVFIVLFFQTAGYGQFISNKWGPSINNRIGWIIMEAPVIIVYIILWTMSDRNLNRTPVMLSCIFLTHYFQRTLIFPFLIRGKSKMPLSIIIFGMIFNIGNAVMQAGWIFYFSDADKYTNNWIYTPQFIVGVLIFIRGFLINLQSDNIIRSLRKDSAKRYGIPRGGMFRYVTCANYFGELTEWIGWCIMTWSLSGLVFAIWTFANLGPRAHSLQKWYSETFGEEFDKLHRKKIIPFVF